MTQQLPDVPDTLPDLAAEHTTTVQPGWPLVRIHDLAGRFPREYHEPRWFGPHPDKSRFDHHPQGRPRDHAPDHGIISITGDDPTAPQPPPRPPPERSCPATRSTSLWPSSSRPTPSW